MSTFVHLHTHSHYSLLQALPKIPDLVKHVKSLGMDAVALTDNGNLYGAIEFYQECKKQGIKALLGIDAYVALRTRLDKEPRIDNRSHRVILMAKNADGYKNLIKLVTTSNLDGFYYKPRIDRELMQRHAEHLLCILPSFSSEVSSALKNKDSVKAREYVDFYKATYGADNVYIEITHHPELEGHEALMKQLIAFARETNTPIVAAHDTYYLKPDDKQARATLVSIQNGGGEISERKYGLDGEFDMIDQATAEKLFINEPDALENVRKIVDTCNLDMQLGKWLFPHYTVESGRTHDDELRYIVYETGLKRRNMELTDDVKQRIEYELEVIKTKGYAPYFLVVSDLLRFAHQNGILTTIRGSVAGSIVTYLAGITNVDPLAYKLPFERFLNPERPSAPDIDMDYADNRRDEVIEYARNKYGSDKVAQIGTFGTMMARGAVRDVARALGFPYATGDTISKLIPMGSQGMPMTIDHAIEITPDLKKMYDRDDEARQIIDMAKKIEGCARHISVHAAGVVISPIPLNEIVPVQLDTKDGGKIITQYDMHSVDENSAGLLKFDFLGIKNLAILADAIDRIDAIEHIKVDIENIPVDDPKTFAMLARGETTGLFQLNGGGMTQSLKELKPTTIHDINVMVALYRPGPMDNINDYIARKHGRAPVTFLHPKMKDFLATTFGVLVYQDDLLMTAIEVAGYTWGEVDKFRKAVGKKIPEEMAKQHVIFVEGCVKHGGMTQEKAEDLWKLFEPFQGYGFNKAHAASYGKVAYQTAYLKANYPAIYMSAVLTADSGDVEKIAEIIAACVRMKIDVLPPDINESFSGFSVVRKEGEPDRIRFGLTTIKNFGEGIADAIIAERKANGPFTTLANFLERVTDRNLNKKSLESLTKAGAMDRFGDRGLLLANIEGLLAFNKEHKDMKTGHDSLFGDMGGEAFPLRLDEAPDATLTEKLNWEKDLLGLYVSGHPLDTCTIEMKRIEMDIKQVKEQMKEGMLATIYGVISTLKPFMTKKNDTMYFVQISDRSGGIEGVVFPKNAEQHKELLVPDMKIAIQGRLNMRKGSMTIVIERMRALKDDAQMAAAETAKATANTPPSTSAAQA